MQTQIQFRYQDEQTTRIDAFCPSCYDHVNEDQK